MSDTTTLRDHTQPCEHPQLSQQREVGTTYEYTEHFGAYLDEEAGGWVCGDDWCLGGRERTFRQEQEPEYIYRNKRWLWSVTTPAEARVFVEVIE